jgi:hypothetical protein
MEPVILWTSAALVVFALWAIARHDWLRLTRASVKVKAKVIGHRYNSDDGQKSYSARFAFDAAGQPFEVVDQLLVTQRSPTVGTELWLHYPQGRPDLARIPRPATWAMVYAVLLAMLTVLIFKLCGGLI